MKKTLNMDGRLLSEARAACGASIDTATVRAGLEVQVQRAAGEKLRRLLGTESHVRDTPRRREPGRARGRAAQ